MSAQPTQPSLYERLGGIYSIACVVDDLIDRVMTDPRLNANPAVNEAHHKVPPPGFKYSRDRNGRLGLGRSAEIYRTPDARVSRPPEYHAQRVGRVHG
jgi:hypothetical protein